MDYVSWNDVRGESHVVKYKDVSDEGAVTYFNLVPDFSDESNLKCDYPGRNLYLIRPEWILDSSVGIVAKLWAVQPRICDFTRGFILLQTVQSGCAIHSVSHSTNTGGCFFGGESAAVSISPFAPRVMPRLRTRGNIPQFLLMPSWCLQGEKLSFNVPAELNSEVVLIEAAWSVSSSMIR